MALSQRVTRNSSAQRSNACYPLAADTRQKAGHFIMAIGTKDMSKSTVEARTRH